MNTEAHFISCRGEITHLQMLYQCPCGLDGDALQSADKIFICCGFHQDTITQTRSGFVHAGFDESCCFFFGQICPRDTVFFQFVGKQLQNFVEQCAQIRSMQLIESAFLCLQTVFCKEGEGTACKAFQSGYAGEDVFSVQCLCGFGSKAFRSACFADAFFQHGKAVFPIFIVIEETVDILPQRRDGGFFGVLSHFAA